jgi:hypothetical protein
MSVQRRKSSEKCLEAADQQLDWFVQSSHCTCKEELELKDTMMDGKLSDIFAQLCKEQLGFKDMRLDLFYD